MADEIAFEKALERLEKIVGDLESGDVKLEDSLKRFEEGVKLTHACQTKLAQAEQKIEVLNRSLDGSFTKEPFNLEGEEGAKRLKSKKSR